MSGETRQAARCVFSIETRPGAGVAIYLSGDCDDDMLDCVEDWAQWRRKRIERRQRALMLCDVWDAGTA